ncbi:Chloramphenicol acetyltransferase [compost metagenome]
MNFNPIDIDNWSRKPYFDHYLNNVRCTYSMTANIDITHLQSVAKNNGIKLYPALIHMITTVINRHILNFAHVLILKANWVIGTARLPALQFSMRMIGLFQVSGLCTMKNLINSTAAILMM